MRRKHLRTVLIVLGSLVLLFIIIGPAVPLWTRLGVRPVCLQGEWPHIKIVSCATQPSAITPTPMPLPSLSAQGPIPIIVDDDGSPDGTIALLFFLSNPRFDVRAVTISQGEAHPGIFARRIQQLLASLNRTDIPVGAGSEKPVEGSNAFPDAWRQASDSFWGIELPQVKVGAGPAQAADLMVDIVRNSSQPVLIFVSGSHTNLAEALRTDPGIAENIGDVYIMGGSIYIPGNIHSDWSGIENEVAEWNIWVDVVAADEVFSSGLPLHLVPLDATRKVMWGPSDLTAWQAFTSPEGKMASRLLQWMMDSWSAKGVYVWDLVTAAQATNPALCKEGSLVVDIITTPGNEQGRTVVGKGTPNTKVCLEPDAEQVKALTSSILNGK